MNRTSLMNIIRMALVLPLMLAVSVVVAQPGGKGEGRGKSGSSEKSKKDKGEKDDKDKDDDDDDGEKSDSKKIEERLAKIGEIVRDEAKDKSNDKDDEDEKVRELPPGLEALVSNDNLKNAPPAWGRWSRAERFRWIKEMEKYRAHLSESAKTKKDFSDNDLESSLKSLDSLAAMGVEPKDATSALNGLIEKGYRGDDLAGAFKGFTGGSAVKSAGDSGGGLGDLLRGQLEDLLKGKGAVLIDILDDGKVNSPAPAPAPAPAPPAPGPGSSIPSSPAPSAGGVPAVSPVKDSTPERAAKKGKMR